MKVKSIKKAPFVIVATNGKPTIFFMVNDLLKQLLLLDGSDNKMLKFSAFETFELHTTELISYEL